MINANAMELTLEKKSSLESKATLDANASRHTLISKLTKIDWSRFFPLDLPTCDCSIQYVEPKEAFHFIRNSYETIFELDQWGNSFLVEPHDFAKESYYQECGDFFMIFKDSLPIGVFIGNIQDWSTYYFRSAAVLPQYQGNGAIAHLLNYLFKILTEAGVQRIESDASVGNFTSIQILLRARFKVTGMQLSERWGALLRFTKFLSPPCEEVFMNQFNLGKRRQ